MTYFSYDRIAFILCLSAASFIKLDAEIGNELWRFSAGDVLFSSPALDSSGNIYFGALNGRVYSVDDDGNERWSAQTGDWVESSVALSPDESTIYVGSWDNSLYAIDSSTGVVKWTFATGSLIFSSPAVAQDGTVYFGGADGFVYGLSPDGISLWETFVGGEVDASIAVGPNGNLYAATSEGVVLSLDRDSGEEIWSFQVPVEPGA